MRKLPKQPFIIMFIFVIGMFLGSFVYLKFIDKNTSFAQVQTTPVPIMSPQADFIESESNVVSEDSNSFNVLLMGHGGSGHSGGGLMDSIIVLHINKTDKKAALISIPRDFFFSGHKINEDPSIKDAVASITGLSIGDYISIDFNGFIKAIDLLGGIEIEIEKPYTDNFYPVRGLENETCGKSDDKIVELHQNYSGFNLEKQFECRYETIHFDTGKTKINGETALKYVRSRHGDGDFGRSGRQFVVLKALAKSPWNLEKIESMISLVKTNLELGKIRTLFSFFGNPDDYQINTVHLTDANVLVSSKSQNGAYILIPRAGIDNYDEIRNFIAK